MTKQDLAKKVAAETGVEFITVKAVIECAAETIKASLINQEPVFLRGFGTFHNKERKPKTARNITANTTIIVPGHKVPAFRPCKEFKDEVK